MDNLFYFQNNAPFAKQEYELISFTFNTIVNIQFIIFIIIQQSKTKQV